MNSSLIAIIKSGAYTCAAIDRDGSVYYRASGIGVKPIVSPMRTNRAYFSGAQVADKVIGRAAALLLALSGASAVYGEIMSRTAVEILKAHGIAFQYGSLVDHITNRTGTGLCPLEQCVLEESDPTSAWEKITLCIERLMASAASTN